MILKNSLKILAFSTAFIILYHDTLRFMFNKWLTPEGSHGPLIVLVSLYLIWIKRKDIKNIPASPGLLPGSALLAAGCFMLFAGKISNTILIEQMSLIPVLLGTILLFWGFNHFKIFLLPVGYLVFLMGFIETLLGSISIHLQVISARISYYILDVIGFPVLWSATIIELPHITLEVARGCNGINHIVSLLAFAAVLAYLNQKTLSKKIILVLIAFFIGIFANGLRIALIGIYTKFSNAADIHGPHETLYVSFIFFFGLLVLVILSHFLKKAGFSRKQNVSAMPQKVAWTCSATLSSNITSSQHTDKTKNSFFPTITGITIFVFTLGVVYFFQPESVYLKNPLHTFPSYIGGLTGNDLIRIDERIRPFSADEELLRMYEDASGNRFELYIGYFTIQTREKKIIDYRRAWMHEETVVLPVLTGQETVRINKTFLRDRSSNTFDIYYWYFMNGRIITNPFAGKFFTFWDALTKRKTNGGVVILRANNPEKDILPFLIDALPLIQNHLSQI